LVKLSEITKKGGASLLLQFVGLAISLGLNLYMTNKVGKTEYSFYVLSFSWITLLAHFSLLGYDVLITREMSRPDNSDGIKSALFTRAIVLAILASFFLGCGLFGVSYVLIEQEQLRIAMLLSSAGIPIFSLLLLMKAYMKGHKRNEVAIISENLVRPGLFILAMATSIGIFSKLTIPWIILLNIAAIFISLLVAIALAKVKTTKNEAASPFDPKFKKAAWTFFFLSVVAMANNLADIIMLGFWEQTLPEVGTYKIDLNLTNFVAMPLITLNAVISPYLVEFFNDRTKHTYLKQIKVLVRIIFAFGMILCIAFALAPNFFLNLFGKDYLLGAVPLIILGFGQLFNVFVGPVGNALNMANSERIVFRVSALTLVLNLGLNTLLIPYYGLIGAAVATVSALVLWNIILAIQLKIKHGVNVSII